MTTTASDLVERVKRDLLDTDNDRWTEADHLENMSAAQRDTVLFKPTSNVGSAATQLVSGIRQSLPGPGVELVDISRNMGLDGVTPGSSITSVTGKDMDELHPGWRSDPEDTEVVHYMFNDQDRTKFDVYPGQPAVSQGYVEIIYSFVPDQITSIWDNLTLGDEYAEAVFNYMMFAAYRRNAASSMYDAERAVGHWNLFLSLIGRKDLVEQQYPKRRQDKYGNVNQSVS